MSETATTDWLDILKEQTRTGEQMGRQVPEMLAKPEITEGQVKALFQALETQAEFVERLTAILEDNGYDFDIISAAERLEDKYADLAGEVAEKLKGMKVET
ncbi:hypothetical protein ABFT80_11745 [Mesorhizobium sp. SB112]|uniref:hypothetical protein n=1 Tax=Mesorhizobium sp. SB112 TaxID=3151853 RepID=UPI003263AB39